jgi:hypothetical protein
MCYFKIPQLRGCGLVIRYGRWLLLVRVRFIVSVRIVF